MKVADIFVKNRYRHTHWISKYNGLTVAQVIYHTCVFKFAEINQYQGVKFSIQPKKKKMCNHKISLAIKLNYIFRVWYGKNKSIYVPCSTLIHHNLII